MNPIPLGRYRHYKGNEYEVIGFAKHGETLEDMVIYKALYGERETWVRPLSMWEDPIEVDGKTVKRFELAVVGADSGQQGLLENIEKLRSTPMGIERIRRNLSLEVPDVIAWYRDQAANAQSIVRKGKNWYVYTGSVAITINARSCTIITAHKAAETPDQFR